MRAFRALLVLTVAIALLLPAAASAQAPAREPVPAAFENGLPPLKPEHVIAGVVGLLAGDTILHSMLGLPNGISLLVGAAAGYYIYVEYLEPGMSSGARRIKAATRDASVQLSTLQERAESGAAEAYRWIGERLAPVF